MINIADTKAPDPMGWPTSPEWVADFDWKWWPASIGIPGRHRRNPHKDAAGAVRAFPSPQWTLEYDLARMPGLAAVVHQAIMLAKGQRGRTPDQIIADASAEVAAWQADAALDADGIAATIYEPLYKNKVSKAEAAEHLAKLIDELPEDAAAFRPKLPGYLVEAIDYATGADGAQAA